jgi:hypothetical protein
VVAVLRWKHGKAKSEVRDTIQAELRELGHDGRVKWEGFNASASVGWGAALNVAGEVSEHVIVLERCGGAAGATVLHECRRILEQLFPGGEEP